MHSKNVRKNIPFKKRRSDGLPPIALQRHLIHSIFGSIFNDHDTAMNEGFPVAGGAGDQSPVGMFRHCTQETLANFSCPITSEQVGELKRAAANRFASCWSRRRTDPAIG
jgi:hypothetical protein